MTTTIKNIRMRLFLIWPKLTGTGEVKARNCCGNSILRMDKILFSRKFDSENLKFQLNLGRYLAFKACCHKVIDIERFIINSCFISQNPRLITNFEVMSTFQGVHCKIK